jgi:hypothetical protein
VLAIGTSRSSSTSPFQRPTPRSRRRRSQPTSMSGTRSHSPSTGRAHAGFWRRPPRRPCAWAAPRTPSSAPLRAARRWIDQGVIGEPALPCLMRSRARTPGTRTPPSSSGSEPDIVGRQTVLPGRARPAARASGWSQCRLIARPTRGRRLRAARGPVLLSSAPPFRALLPAAGGSAQTIHSFDSARVRAPRGQRGEEHAHRPRPGERDRREDPRARRGAKAPGSRRPCLGEPRTGVLEMAQAIRAGLPHQAEAPRHHVLDTLA